MNVSKDYFLSFLPLEVKKDIISKWYYNFHTTALKDLKVDLEFKHVDLKEEDMEQVKKIHPEMVSEILKLEPCKVIDEKNLTWSHYKYGKNQLYVGQFNKNMEREGRGLYYWIDDKSYYVGYWKANNKEIYGKFVHHNKITYEGEVINGEKNGNGKAYLSNGDKYVGLFKNGVKQGKGIYYWSNGSYWEGESVSGQLHGEGYYVDKHGNKKMLRFDMGKFGK